MLTLTLFYSIFIEIWNQCTHMTEIRIFIVFLPWHGYYLLSLTLRYYIISGKNQSLCMLSYHIGIFIWATIWCVFNLPLSKFTLEPKQIGSSQFFTLSRWCFDSNGLLPLCSQLDNLVERHCNMCVKSWHYIFNAISKNQFWKNIQSNMPVG